MVFTSLNMSTDGIRAKLDWTQSIPSKDKQSYSVKNIVISPGVYEYLYFYSFGINTYF